MSWYLKTLKNYAVFKGRARRKEYWTFILWNALVAFVLGLIDAGIGVTRGNDPSVLVTLYYLATVLPAIAVGVRRIITPITAAGGCWSPS